jgi:formylmethanofuran:tetrahydromethanopterin formyltransferase
MTTFIDTVASLSIKDKRALVKSLREMIKEDVLLNRGTKSIIKANKEAEKKAKIEAQIKAAADKLAKLQAKLTA